MTDSNEKKKNDPVVEFYQSYNEQDRDMTTLEHGRKGIPSVLIVFLILLLGFLAAAAWVGYQYVSTGEAPFFFKKSDQFLQTSFTFNRESVITGDLVSGTLFFKNVSPHPLNDVSVLAQYPAGFTFVESSPVIPKNEQKNFWNIGPLASGEELTIVIRGRVAGSDQESKEFKAQVFYKPVNLSSEFSSTVQSQISILASPFRLRMEGPAYTQVSRDVTYIISVQRPSRDFATPDTSLPRQLEVRLEMPAGFSVKELKPAPSRENKIWDMDALLGNIPPSQDEVTITVRGNFAESSISGQRFNVQLGYLLGQEYAVLDETTFVPQIVAPAEKSLTLDLSLGGSRGKAFVQPADPMRKDPLPLMISYANTGTKTFSDLSLVVRIAKNGVLRMIPDELALPKSEPAFSYALQDQGDSEIRITPAEIPSLKELRPSASGTITLYLDAIDYRTLRTILEQNASSDIVNTFDISLTAEIGNVKEDEPTQGEEESRFVQGPVIPVMLNSDTSLSVTTSDATTVSWTLENTLHELERISVKTTIPESISWTANTSVSAGEMKYNPETREVTWSINRLPRSVHSVKATFEVEGPIAPEALTSTVSATDKSTGASVLLKK